MRVGILTQWYDPEPGPAALPGVLARELARRGHEVHVLTGFPNYPTGKLAPGYRLRPRHRETLDGVAVTRTFLLPQHGRSGVGRIANYLSFGLSSAFFGRGAFRDIDVLWVNYSPITVALPMWLQKLSRRTPLVCEVADLWPDTMLVSGLSGSVALSSVAAPLLHTWTNTMYRASRFVVHIAPGVGPVLTSRGVPSAKLRYVPKPADESNFHPQGVSQRRELGIDDAEVVLLYAGSMGTAQGLDSLIRAVRDVDDARIRLLMAGSGSEESALRLLAQGDERIVFLGRQPMERMADLLATADVAFVGLADHPLSAVTMPSKTQTILASGTAALVSASGDVADVVRDAEAGYIAESGSPDSIAQAIRACIGDGRDGLAAKGLNGRRSYVANFSVRATTDAIESLLVEAVNNTSGGTGRLRASDVAAVAALHRNAFPEFFLSQLGEPFLCQFYRGFLDDPTAITAVERNDAGAPVAVAVGSSEPRGFFGRLLKRRWLGFASASAAYAVRNPRAIPRLVRAISYRGATPETAEGALLSSICVSPASQGSGAGRRVLAAWTREASNKGARKAFLTTDALENDTVRSFYERQRWTVEDEFTTPEGRTMARYTTDLVTDEATVINEAGN